MSFVDSAGARIYYERHGAGPAVVFCHGAGSNAATWWQQIPEFSRYFTTITVDNRCFGRSSAPLAQFIPELFPRDLAAVLDAESISSAALVCQSLGGMTGVRFALQNAARVSALVCCDSPMAVDHPAMMENVHAYLRTSGGTSLEQRALGRKFLQEEPEKVFLYQQLNQFNPAVYGDAPRAAWSERLAALFAPDYLIPPEQLSGITCPTLFVVGSEDPLVRPDVLRDIARHVAGGQVLEMKDAGHSPYFEQPLQFNAAVCGFLRGHLLPADVWT